MCGTAWAPSRSTGRGRSSRASSPPGGRGSIRDRMSGFYTGVDRLRPPLLPPGNYTIVAWHEKYGQQEQNITVGAKEAKTVDFTFKG